MCGLAVMGNVIIGTCSKESGLQQPERSMGAGEWQG